MRVLDELEVEKKPIITVFNKIDLLPADSDVFSILMKRYPDAIFVSTKTGKGIKELVERIEKLFNSELLNIEIELPLKRYDLAAFIYRNGKVYKEEYNGDMVKIFCCIPSRIKKILITSIGDF